MRPKFFLTLIGSTLLLLVGMALAPSQQATAKSGEINLYSYRQPFLIKPILDEFTKKTGIKVNVVYARKGMLERIKAEGKAGPADAVLTVDIG
ncbi:MAG: iron ABC transporter substrate-binding protein, partial [Rhodospirillales bacterium]